MQEGEQFPTNKSCYVWYIDETVSASGSIYSPIFDIDRFQGLRSGRAAPTGDTSAGDDDALYRVWPIGDKVLAHIQTTTASGANFIILGSTAENTNPITAVTLKTQAFTIGTPLVYEQSIGFPFVQFKITNTDAGAGLVVKGAVRIYTA